MENLRDKNAVVAVAVPATGAEDVRNGEMGRENATPVPPAAETAAATAEGDAPAENPHGKSAVVAVAVPATGAEDSQNYETGGENAPPVPPTAGTAAATTEGDTNADTTISTPPNPKKKRTKSEAALDRWAEIRAGKRPDPREKRVTRRCVNPVFDLSGKLRVEIMKSMREGNPTYAVLEMLVEQGITGITLQQIHEFFDLESVRQWETRLSRAADEAHSLERAVLKFPANFSAGIVHILGQECFRHMANGNIDPDSVGKLTALFLRASHNLRSEEMHALKREKLRHELHGQAVQALEELAIEVECRPAAREAFETLRLELTKPEEETP